MSEDQVPSSLLPAWIRMLRPAQWLKNGIIPAAWVFAHWDPSQRTATLGWEPIIAEGLAVFFFCLLSSGVYLMNDLRDRDADRLHPTKSHRPIAAGEVSPLFATIVALFLGIGSLTGSYLLLPHTYALILGGYALMQIAYTFLLKRIAYVDVFVISFGFVLRAIAGAAAITVRISPWLLLCTFMLSLFLALCKRRHEKLLLEKQKALQHRSALAGYDPHLLDLQIAITASATLVSYAIYSLSGETASRFGTHQLGWTIPFVIFGIFRYMDLVYRHESGGRPEKVLLTDKVMIITLLGYLITVFAVFFFAR